MRTYSLHMGTWSCPCRLFYPYAMSTTRGSVNSSQYTLCKYLVLLLFSNHINDSIEHVLLIITSIFFFSKVSICYL